MSEWHNWADTQSCECTLLKPGNLVDLQAEVLRAAKAGQRIRPAGGSYSWAPLVKNEGGTIIDTSLLTEVLSIDEENCTVTVEAGVTIEQLTAATHEHGLALITPPLFPKPTIGGTIGPGCHGTGWKDGNFSDQILEMTIVKADGTLECVDIHHRDYHAAQVNLGTFGIIYSVKLKVEPEFNVYADKRLVSTDEMLASFDDLMETYEFLEMMWFPLEKKIWMYLMNRTQAPADTLTWWDKLKEKINTFIENFGASVLVPWVARHMPGLTPTLNHLATNMSNSVSTSILPSSTEFHFQHAYPKCLIMSYAVPSKHAKLAWSEAIALVEEFAAAGQYPINLAMHCRFTGASDSWLGPDHDRDTLYIEAATVPGTPHYEEFFKSLEQRWFAIEGARPHWSKIYYTADQLAARYPRMNAFLDARQRWDPDRVFLNSFLEKEVFKLPAPGASATLADVEPVPAPLPPLGSPTAGN